MLRLVLGALPLLAGVERAHAGSNGLAITPQMGWNTWNHFGCDISEDTIVTAAQAFLDYNLTQYGYECAYSLVACVALGLCVGNYARSFAWRRRLRWGFGDIPFRECGYL